MIYLQLGGISEVFLHQYPHPMHPMSQYGSVQCAVTHAHLIHIQHPLQGSDYPTSLIPFHSSRSPPIITINIIPSTQYTIHFPQSNHAQLPTTLPCASSAKLVNIARLKSKSVAAHPTQRSTTSTSTLLLLPTVGSNRVIRIIFPHNGLSFEFELVEAASKMKCETAQIASVDVFW
jgi:hypothetical protein